MTDPISFTSAPLKQAAARIDAAAQTTADTLEGLGFAPDAYAPVTAATGEPVGGTGPAHANGWGVLQDGARKVWQGMRGVPGAAAQDARRLAADAEHLALNGSKTMFSDWKIERDPADVNAPRGREVGDARGALARRADLETAAVAALGERERSHYAAISALLETRPEGERIMARRALQSMLLDGRLTAPQRPGEPSLLGALGGLAAQRVAQGIDPATLVAEVLCECEDPVRINQRQKNTCGAATAQILLARKNPAEYVRVVAGLASPEGRVRLAGGDAIQRDGDWNNSNDGGRSTPSRLLQPALMTLGQLHPRIKYSNDKDNGELGDRLVPGASGLMMWGEARINSQLQGTSYDGTLFNRLNRDALWNQVKAALADGKGPIPSGVHYFTPGETSGTPHYVQIDKVEAGRVHFTNPWGREESVGEDDFKSHAYDAVIPD